MIASSNSPRNSVQPRNDHVVGSAPSGNDRQYCAPRRHFSLVFLSVLTLTVGCLLLAGFVSLFGGNPLAATAQRIFDASLLLFTFGAASIIRLLSGRPESHERNFNGSNSDVDQSGD